MQILVLVSHTPESMERTFFPKNAFQGGGGPIFFLANLLLVVLHGGNNYQVMAMEGEFHKCI